MKTQISIALLLLFASSVSALTCQTGFYDSGASKCTRCPIAFASCTSSSVGSYLTQISGYTSSSGSPAAYCGAGYYNKNTNNCELICKTGCATCNVDYDFCTDCNNGYAWNPDFTCLPAVIGLEAATLALLTIGLVFLIISCCLVNKARK